jgi:hypothetical protein
MGSEGSAPEPLLGSTAASAAALTRTSPTPGSAGRAGGGGGGAGGGGGGKSMLELLLERDPATGFLIATTAVIGMEWRDEAAHRFGLFCK